MNYLSHVENLSDRLKKVLCTNSEGDEFESDRAYTKWRETLLAVQSSKNKVLCVGNGGSAAIAQHFQVDCMNALKIHAVTFYDAPLLTCYANDHDYRHAFEMGVERMGKKGDLLLAISSSGKSENIILAVKKALETGCHVVTMSGFDPVNALRKLGHINFFIDSNQYGIVEVAHQALAHHIIDIILEKDI